jgi:hypothetical protein
MWIGLAASRRHTYRALRVSPRPDGSEAKRAVCQADTDKKPMTGHPLRKDTGTRLPHLPEAYFHAIKYNLHEQAALPPCHCGRLSTTGGYRTHQIRSLASSNGIFYT